MAKVKVYSNEHSAWWNPNYNGYTENEEEAGVYELDEILADYPELDFNEDNEDYLVGYDCMAVLVECVNLLSKDGINSKLIAKQKLIDLINLIKAKEAASCQREES